MLVNANTFSVPSEETESDSSRIYGAFSAGINIYLNAHQDNDFTYCEISIHIKREHICDDKAVVYYSFPQLRVMISGSSKGFNMGKACAQVK